MEFWGVEVKSDSSLHVEPGEDMLVHISQVALGENKNNEKETVRLFLEVGDQKLLIGTLSHEKFPQMGTEIVLEKGFELSHSWKNGSVFFTGYKVDASDPEDEDINNDDSAIANGQPAAAKQVNFKLPNEDGKAKEDESSDDDESEDESSDDESEDESGDEEEKKVTAEVDNEDDDEDDSSDSDDDDSSADDETPKKPEEAKKRSSAEANTSKNPATSNKKAKFVTPQKPETSKKPHVHVATPHPGKGKNSGSNGEASKTPKTGGSFGCKSCNRTFGSEMGLQSHTKAKHSAAA